MITLRAEKAGCDDGIRSISIKTSSDFGRLAHSGLRRDLISCRIAGDSDRDQIKGTYGGAFIHPVPGILKLLLGI
ncbi:MAG: hypothetical protein ACOYYI_02780 [Chloroflexota bacterium]